MGELRMLTGEGMHSCQVTYSNLTCDLLGGTALAGWPLQGISSPIRVIVNT